MHAQALCLAALSPLWPALTRHGVHAIRECTPWLKVHLGLRSSLNTH